MVEEAIHGYLYGFTANHTYSFKLLYYQPPLSYFYSCYVMVERQGSVYAKNEPRNYHKTSVIQPRDKAHMTVLVHTLQLSEQSRAFAIPSRV